MTNGRRNHPGRDPWGFFAEFVKHAFFLLLGALALFGIGSFFLNYLFGVIIK